MGCFKGRLYDESQKGKQAFGICRPDLPATIVSLQCLKILRFCPKNWDEESSEEDEENSDMEEPKDPMENEDMEEPKQNKRRKVSARD